MRRFLLALTALSAGLFAPAAASAQIAGKRDYGPVGTSSPFLPDSSLAAPPLGRELRQMRGRIERARENGLLTRREARALDREARALGRLGGRYARDGLSAAERRELQARTAALRGRLRGR